MTTTQRPRTPRRSSPPPGPGPAARGVILVVIGVVLGLILLARSGGIGFEPDSSGLSIDTGGTTTTTEAPSTTAAPTTDRPPQSVTVVVANGSGVSGLAGKTAGFLAQAGYVESIATDAESQVAESVVYFAPGFEASAAAIARLLALPENRVQALPPGAKLAGNQPTDAGVIAVIAADVATTVGATAPTTVAGAPTTVAGAVPTTTQG